MNRGLMKSILLGVVLLVTGALGSSPLNRIRICQGDIGSISCPVGQSLHIYSAYYGRFVSGEEACPHRTVTPTTDLSCIADVEGKVKVQCDGYPKCAVKAANRNFEDRCRGVFKHLDIEFYCTQDAIPTTEPYTTQSLSEQVADCLDVKRTMTDTCEALLMYKTCLLSIEMRQIGRAPEIERVLPTLDESIRSCQSPVIMLCKHKNLHGRCMNVTSATPDLGDLDNSVQSMKVFSGNWALYSEPNFKGRRYEVRDGFTSLWMGVYSPEYGGSDLHQLGRSLSSVAPLELLAIVPTTQESSLTFTSDGTEATTDLTEGSVSLGTVGPTEASDAPIELDPGYTTWVKLDDIPSSGHPTMCRSTYCILGVRVIFPKLRTIALPAPYEVNSIITDTLVDAYGIRREQLVHVGIDEMSSELELQIIDMKRNIKRVVDVAREIQNDVQHEKFIFMLGGLIIAPDSQRYGVTLKTVPEEYLPYIQTDSPDLFTSEMETVEPEETSPTQDAEATSTPNNEIETDSTFYEPTSHGSIVDKVHDVVLEAENEVPRKYFYPLLGAAIGFFALLVGLAMVLFYRWYQSHDYMAIKRAGSSTVYVDTPPPCKKMEGFENPSYLLDEVDHHM